MIESLIAGLMPLLIQVESSGQNGLVGDKDRYHKAYGPLQIRQPVCDDYNRVHGTKVQAQDCRHDLRLSKKICRWYLKFYAAEKHLGRKPTIEDCARIWNGGPDGWREGKTKPYWAKVKRELNKKKEGGY